MRLHSIPARYQTPAAALCALLLGAAWLTAWGWRHQATNAVVEQELQRGIAVATSLSNALLPRYRDDLKRVAAARDGDGRLPAALGKDLADLLRGQRVARISIHDARGAAIYTTEDATFTSGPGASAEIQRALRGEGFAQLIQVAAPGTDAERDFVRAFVPANPGVAQPQEAVFEIYTDVTGVMKGVRDEAHSVFANANLVGLTLFAVALMILRRAEEEQRRKDVVTGLPGRENALAAMAEALKGVAEGPPVRVGWLLVGLQRLRQVSAAYGHKSAEEVLRQAAARLQSLPGAELGLFRLGGEAFAMPVIDRSSGLSDAELAERLAFQVQVSFDTPIACEGHTVMADLAIGIALGAGREATAEELMNRAEVSMTEAKRRGSGQWALYVPGLELGVRDRLQAIGDLREAWEQRQFQVYYQPLVDSGTRRWVGCEALVRWIHPDRGIIHPESFVPLLEETGLIVEVGLFVLRESCRQMAEWRETLDSRLAVSVNLSARQFADPDLLKHIRDVLADTRLPAEALIIEVTETFLALDPEYAIEVLTELRKLGVAVAIDDFGVGYSSLSALRRLPVDILKIDRSFVSQAPTDPIDASIAQAIAALARGLSLTLVAEGVETEAQADFTRDIGCQKHQGYLFARPLDAATFEASYPDRMI
ncbi:MAG: phosphodiesterase [Rhodocyclales bacterium]|nr:phosphodiesterase [Rhodocyclales bacterium]